MNTANWACGIEVEHPGGFSALLVRWVNILIWPVVRFCFRPRLEGVEHLPKEGPYLLVSNHSAGLGLAEILSFMALYFRQVGPDKRLAGFALPQGFHVFPLNRFLRAVGAIPSTYEAARKTLGAGVPILVFPGGDHETLRPVWQANHVDFGGRVGFLKIAREMNVPVVPMGVRGAHYTCPIFYRAKWLAWFLLIPRLLGIKRWGISLLSILGIAGMLSLSCLPWGWRILLAWFWSGSILVFLPCIPWKIRFRIGPALQSGALFQETEDLENREALAAVESAIEKLIWEK